MAAIHCLPQGYHDFIDEMLPHESPVHYGLHPNAEIEFLTVTSDNLFHTLLELQSPDAVMGEGATQTLEEKVRRGLFLLPSIMQSRSLKLKSLYLFPTVITR